MADPNPLYPVELDPELQKEVGKISASMEPLRRSQKLDDEEKPKKRFGGRARGAKNKKPFEAVRSRRKEKPNPISQELAQKIAERTNLVTDPERREATLKSEGEAALKAPFDPQTPVTTEEHALQNLSKETALINDVRTWQDKLSLEQIKSIDRIVHLRDHAYSEQVQLRAAQDLLDRAGVDMRKKTVTTTIIYADRPTEDLLAELEKLDLLESSHSVPLLIPNSPGTGGQGKEPIKFDSTPVDGAPAY